MKIQGNGPLKSTGAKQSERNKGPGNEHKWEAPGQSRLVDNSG